MSTRSILFQFFENLICAHAACQQLLQHSLRFSLLCFFCSLGICLCLLCFQLLLENLMGRQLSLKQWYSIDTIQDYSFSHLYFSLFPLHIFSHCGHPLQVYHKSANKSALYTPASSIFRKLSFTSATSSL